MNATRAAVLLFVGLLFLATAARATGHAAPLQLFAAAARRYDTQGGRVSALLFGGHVAHLVPLAVQWPAPTDAAAAADNGTVAALVLRRGDILAATQLPAAAWYDGQTAWTRERLALQARGRVTELFAAEAGADDARAASLAGDARHRGVLDARVASALWLAHRALVFTGAGIALVPRAAPPAHVDRLLTGRPAGADEAEIWRLPLAGRRMPVAVVNVTTGERRALNAQNATRLLVRVVWAPESDLTVLPLALFQALKGGENRWGVAVDATLLVDADERPAGSGGGGGLGRLTLRALDLVTEATWDAAPDAPLVVGRRWMQRSVRGWAYDAVAGAWAVAPVAAAGSGNEGPPPGVRALAAALGLVLAWLYSYWVSELIVHLVPGGGGSAAAAATSPSSSSVWQRARMLIHTVLLLAAGVPAHVLALVYAGTGPLLDTTLAAPLRRFTLELSATSLPLAVLLVAAALWMVARRRYRPWHTEPRAGAWWRNCLLASLHAAVVVRSLVACVLVTAGGSMLGLLVLATLAAVGLVYQGLYAALLLAATTAAAPASAWRHGLGPVWYASACAQVAAVVVAVIGARRDVFTPLLAVANTFYTPGTVEAASLLLFAALALAAAYVLVRELRARLVAAAAEKKAV